MDLAQVLTQFYHSSEKDPCIGPAHIAVFIALAHLAAPVGNTSIILRRDRVMRRAAIRSRQTYRDCVRVLLDRGYLHFCQPAGRGEIEVILRPTHLLH